MKEKIHSKTSSKLSGANINKELKDPPPAVIYADGPHYRANNLVEADNNSAFEGKSNPLTSKGN
ncbi:hypothetical protein FACS189418_6300 [Clostridia bacterium]|nr:hypothetical protein FACS189418_6300 [Clostridia bacterium]